MPGKFLIVIGGPTGVGKTKTAITLARHFHTEIINADSRQVYTELNIGVGKPSASELQLVRHYLMGHISIHNPYSVGHFEKEALETMDQLFKVNDILIVSGGTGLYIKAILEGLDDFPDIPHAISAHWTQVFQEKGLEPLTAALARLDPEYFKTVDPQNPMRLIRALSVCEATGRPFSSLRSGEFQPRHFIPIPILLERSREELYARINQRVLEMLDQGWMAEARLLYPFRELQALDTVGYQELFEVIEGTLTLGEAVPKIQQRTRNYAKRQLTWWNHQGTWTRFYSDDFRQIVTFIENEMNRLSTKTPQ